MAPNTIHIEAFDVIGDPNTTSQRWKRLDSNFELFIAASDVTCDTQTNKTTCTLFTPDPAEYKSNLDLKINTALHMATHPKLTYSTHIHNISVQAHIHYK